MKSSLEKISARKIAILIIIISFVSLVVITMARPLEYSAKSSVFIIKNDDIQTFERTARMLNRFVYTSDFFYKAMNTGFDVSAESFPENEIQRKGEWEESVEIEADSQAGTLTIIAYDETRYKAAELANAVSYALALHGPKIVSPHNIEIKIVENAIASKFPVKFNILQNAGIGLAIGLAVGFIYFQLLKIKIGAIKKEKPGKQKEEKIEKMKKPKKVKEAGKVEKSKEKAIDKAVTKQIKEEKTTKPKEKKKTVGKLIEKEKAEAAFEQKEKDFFDPSKYEYYPEEEIEVMPRKYL